MVPFFAARHVEAAVSPERALEAVREAFVAYARGDWTMPPKVYVPAYPAGDFRAMPALGAGHAALKWVTSFPGNPARGLPTVTGLVLLSDAATGELRALFDAAAVTALRTGAAAVLAAETLVVEPPRPPRSSAPESTAARLLARSWRAGETSRSGTSTRRGRRRRQQSSAPRSPARAKRRCRQTSSSR